MCESDLNTWLANYYEFSSYTSSMQSIWCSFRHLILMSCWVQYYCSYPMIRGSGVAHIHTYQQHILHMRTMRISTFESGRKEDIKFLLYYGFDCNPTATLFNWFFKYFNFLFYSALCLLCPFFLTALFAILFMPLLGFAVHRFCVVIIRTKWLTIVQRGRQTLQQLCCCLWLSLFLLVFVNLLTFLLRFLFRCFLCNILLLFVWIFLPVFLKMTQIN